MTFFKRKRGQDAKMGNTRSLCALGHSHRSKLESSVCQIIQLREKAGELKLLQVEDHVHLTDAAILYIPDFKVQDIASGEVFWIEAKGFADQKWPLKKKLWKFYGPGNLEIWKGDYRRPVLDEVVTPRPNSTSSPLTKVVGE